MCDFSRSSMMLIGPAADQSANFYGSPEWIGMSLSPLTGKWFENSMATNESKLIVSTAVMTVPIAVIVKGGEHEVDISKLRIL